MCRACLLPVGTLASQFLGEKLRQGIRVDMGGSEKTWDAQGTIGFNTKIVISDMDDLGAPLFKEHSYGSSPMTSYGNL